jgi:hypothetical protein
MATTTYEIHLNPTNILPWPTPNGNITAYSQTTGAFTWIPNVDVTGVFPNEFRYNQLCDGQLVDFGFESMAVTGFCNDSFIIKAVKNNCTVGAPSNINYTVPAEVVCGKVSKAEANWEAYLLSLSLAQIQANLGICIVTECVPIPCVLDYSLGKITISATPGYTIRIYKENSILLEIIVPVSGVIVINNELLQGNIYVTQISTTGIESQRNCLPFELVEKCYDNALGACQ